MRRYARDEDLLPLALMIQGSAEGVSLTDIGMEFDVARHTAERMRDAVLNAYPQLKQIDEENDQRRWRFPLTRLALRK